MTVYRHGNKFRADIYHEGERVARESFDTKAEALKFERLETARQLLSEEERYRRDVQEWARHHRFVEKPEYMQRMAEHGRDIAENPAGKIKIRNADVERDRRLEDGEEERLLENANPLLGDIIAIALDTAMREGEIVRIEPKWCKKLGTPHAHLRLPPETKTGKPRSIPLSVRAEEILSRRIKQGNPLFPIKAKTACTKFIALRQRLGIADLRFHDLRHEALSRLAEKGFSTADVMKISGHRSLPNALRYHHPNAGNLTVRLRA